MPYHKQEKKRKNIKKKIFLQLGSHGGSPASHNIQRGEKIARLFFQAVCIGQWVPWERELRRGSHGLLSSPSSSSSSKRNQVFFFFFFMYTYKEEGEKKRERVLRSLKLRISLSHPPASHQAFSIEIGFPPSPLLSPFSLHFANRCFDLLLLPFNAGNAFYFFSLLLSLFFFSSPLKGASFFILRPPSFPPAFHWLVCKGEIFFRYIYFCEKIYICMWISG